jgi:hypothetical protein
MSQEESNERKFQIDVENLFDWEKRKIKVTHHKKDGPPAKKHIDFPDPNNEEKKYRKRFGLSSKEHLEIELDRPEGKEASFWYVKLPFVADFRFVSESGKIPLVYELARNEGTGGRTIALIPTEIDPKNCKLLISPPGGIKENYKMRNIEGELLADGDDIPDDNVSIGDNGSG